MLQSTPNPTATTRLSEQLFIAHLRCCTGTCLSEVAQATGGPFGCQSRLNRALNLKTCKMVIMRKLGKADIAFLSGNARTIVISLAPNKSDPVPDELAPSSGRKAGLANALRIRSGYTIDSFRARSGSIRNGPNFCAKRDTPRV